MELALWQRGFGVTEGVSNPRRNVWNGNDHYHSQPRCRVSNPRRNVWNGGRKVAVITSREEGFKSQKERLERRD